ncbi:unnamed protein product [Brassica oleracea]
MGDMPHAVEGMIRLAEVPDMVASEVQPGNGILCDGPLGFDKGKGKMVDAGVLQDSQGARAYEGSSQLHGRSNTFQYELLRFSPSIPSTKLTGKERNCVPVGSYELDTAALPQMIEDGEEEDW